MRSQMGCRWPAPACCRQTQVRRRSRRPSLRLLPYLHPRFRWGQHLTAAWPSRHFPTSQWKLHPSRPSRRCPSLGQACRPRRRSPGLRWGSFERRRTRWPPLQSPPRRRAASGEGQQLEVSFEPPVARVRPSVMQDLVADTQQVERISVIEPSDFASRFEVPDRPCVLTGAVKTWRATQSWSAAYLKDKVGGVEVKYKLSASHAHPDFHQLTLDKMFSLGKSPFAEFLDEVTVGPPTERAKRLFTG